MDIPQSNSLKTGNCLQYTSDKCGLYQYLWILSFLPSCHPSILFYLRNSKQTGKAISLVFVIFLPKDFFSEHTILAGAKARPPIPCSAMPNQQVISSYRVLVAKVRTEIFLLILKPFYQYSIPSPSEAAKNDNMGVSHNL